MQSYVLLSLNPLFSFNATFPTYILSKPLLTGTCAYVVENAKLDRILLSHSFPRGSACFCLLCAESIFGFGIEGGHGWRLGSSGSEIEGLVGTSGSEFVG